VSPIVIDAKHLFEEEKQITPDDLRASARHHAFEGHQNRFSANVKAIVRAMVSDFGRRVFTVAFIASLVLGGLKLFVLTEPRDHSSVDQPTAAQPPQMITADTTPTKIAPAASDLPRGFMVQLSSQRSEAEAQAAFRSLQAKFPNELGDRNLVIQRADPSDNRGVFYRTLVGPFASSQEASEFCASYKTAGGRCVVR
jgi:hypothetical protein